MKTYFCLLSLLCVGCSAPLVPTDTGRDALSDVQHDSIITDVIVILPDVLEEIIDVHVLDTIEESIVTDVQQTDVVVDNQLVDACNGMVCNLCIDDGGISTCNNYCVDTSSSMQHCGGCNLECRAVGNHQHGECISETCSLVCDEGFADCDSNVAGCESDTSDRRLTGTSVLNCGACGRNCSVIGGQSSCSNGLCACNNSTPCPSWGTCDGFRCIPN